MRDKFVVENKGKRKDLNFPDDHPDYEEQRPIKITGVVLEANPTTMLCNPTNSKTDIVLIDTEDYDSIKFYSLTMITTPDNMVYFNVGQKGGGKTTRLNRLVMKETDPNVFIDHLNGNTFDNRKRNLERTDAQGNSENMSKRKNTSSLFLGVSKRKKDGKFRGRISNKGTDYERMFHIEEHAARYRDLVVLLKLPGTKYKMNYVWTPEEIILWTETLKIK